ncbi:MAG: hypothetical protein JJD92_04310 [Frankiaceae bacterium]|nr:hypothetical protein [Frankiaceae bacterium]
MSVVADAQRAVQSAARLGERWSSHPVLTVAIVALGVRLAAAVLMHVVGVWPVEPDEQQYIDLAGVIASGAPASAWDPAWGHDLFVQTATYLVPVITLFKVFGAHALLAQSVSALGGAVAAAGACRLALELLPVRWAVAAGLLVAVLPSQVLWSSLVLRESAVWAALALLALCCAIGLRTYRTAHLLWLLLAAGTCLFALGHLRPYVLIVAAWSLVLATCIAGAARRAVVPAGAAVLMLVVPILTGAGVGGITLVAENVPVLASIQRHLAEGADSAIVKPAPSPSTTVTAQKPAGARPLPDTEGSTARADLRDLPVGLVSVSLRPFLWERPTGLGSRFAQLENLLWLVLYAMAAIGTWCMRASRRVVAFPVIFTLGFLTMSALFEGNLGTAFRHRGQVLWAIGVLACVGAYHLVHRVRELPEDPVRA